MEAGMGAGEGSEEAVVLELDDLAVVVRDELLDENVVISHQSLPALGPQPLRRSGRIRNVAQHQRDRSVGRRETSELREYRPDRRGYDVDRRELWLRFPFEI